MPEAEQSQLLGTDEPQRGRVQTVSVLQIDTVCALDNSIGRYVSVFRGNGSERVAIVIADHHTVNGQFRRSGGRDQHLGGHAWEAGPSIRRTKLAELPQNAVAGQRAGYTRSAQTNSPLEPAPRFGATSRADHGPQEPTPILRP